MKTIRYCSETFTNAGFVTPDGYGLIERKGPALQMRRAFDKVFCSYSTRSVQTAVAIFARFRKKTVILVQVKKFNSFLRNTLLLKTDFMAYHRREKENNFLDSFYNFFNSDFTAREENYCLEALKDCFSRLADGQSALAVNSSRNILLAANCLSPGKRLTYMEELDYLDFICDDEGKITVAPK